ncbi:MAG: hypothetical protein QOJ27_1964 [Sphingomonadales bacterium]|nr:hypothetical protein [Sphingomonadales bacterium]
MITLLWTAVMAAGPPPAMAAGGHGDAVQRCRPALARKVKGDVENVTVVKFRKTGRETLLNGEISVLERPPVKAGELTPHHIINIRYFYECRFTGRAAPRVRVSRPNN